MISKCGSVPKTVAVILAGMLCQASFVKVIFNFLETFC